MPEPTSDESDGSISDSDGSSDENNSQGDHPTNGWEVFDEDAVYQKKHVDPEMRQWVLTNDCRRIISDVYFDNPAHNQSIHNVFSRDIG
jgi:hypothetical protein